MIDDLTFANKAKKAQAEGVRIRNKEHLHYYAIYRSYFPPPIEEQKEQGGKNKEERIDSKFHCTECMACMPSTGRFCRTCGAFPVVPSKSI
jgi:asparagine synthase (glutamine-hydrolysing)